MRRPAHLERRRKLGLSMLKQGAPPERVAAETGAPLRTVRTWLAQVTQTYATEPTPHPVPPPPVRFVERGLGEMADVPLGAW